MAFGWSSTHAYTTPASPHDVAAFEERLKRSRRDKASPPPRSTSTSPGGTSPRASALPPGPLADLAAAYSDDVGPAARPSRIERAHPRTPQQPPPPPAYARQAAAAPPALAEWGAQATQAGLQLGPHGIFERTRSRMTGAGVRQNCPQELSTHPTCEKPFSGDPWQSARSVPPDRNAARGGTSLSDLQQVTSRAHNPDPPPNGEEEEEDECMRLCLRVVIPCGHILYRRQPASPMRAGHAGLDSGPPNIRATAK
ncbi:hypothetical protein PAPYR_2750 [Paratrimastix pyriformis]|uniref:Uncharacterized protein n=1 Tax=Paratrimastix pyriformis TaxID=342808 RepID=A0ABQ8URF4_9EUKA|nr:hypothetical protein PAPYR_2750 [Paratrimastix pyriformis]